MEKLTVTKIFKSDQSKDGKEFRDRNNKKFWKVACKFDKYGDEWFSCLAFREDDPVMRLEEGDEKIFVIDKSGGYNNFKLPSRVDILESRLDAIESRLRTLEGTKAGPQTHREVTSEEKEEGINIDDIPF